MTTIKRDDWIADARARFGDDPRYWRFECPVCKTEQSMVDFLTLTALDEKVVEGVLGFSCIGRWAEGGCESAAPGDAAVIGCDYAGGGFFKLNPVHVEHEGEVHQVFAWAEAGDGG